MHVTECLLLGRCAVAAIAKAEGILLLNKYDSCDAGCLYAVLPGLLNRTSVRVLLACRRSDWG